MIANREEIKREMVKAYIIYFVYNSHFVYDSHWSTIEWNKIEIGIGIGEEEKTDLWQQFV